MRTVSLVVRIVSLYVDSCSAGAVTWQARHIGARKIVEDELGQSCMMDDTIILMSICDGLGADLGSVLGVIFGHFGALVGQSWSQDRL